MKLNVIQCKEKKVKCVFDGYFEIPNSVTGEKLEIYISDITESLQSIGIRQAYIILTAEENSRNDNTDINFLIQSNTATPMMMEAI